MNSICQTYFYIFIPNNFKMKKIIVLFLSIFIFQYSFSQQTTEFDTPKLTLEEANRLSKLPLTCMNTEYPNKLGQTLGSSEDLKTPKILHPAFYGCFDWHSSVHGHWSLVSLL